MPKKPDRRVQRTQQLLRSALLSLIQEKGYEALSVQDITDRANVGRATFYTHFDNKEDLLVSGFEDLRTCLKQRQREARSHGRNLDDLFAFSHELFAHTNDHREIFRAMVGKRSGAVVERMLHKLVLELVRDDMKTMAGAAPSGSVPQEAVAQYVAGSLFGLMMWWLSEKKRVSVSEIDQIFRRLSISAVKAALR